MTYSYQNRLSWLGTRKKEIDSVSITAHRTGESDIPLQATIEYHSPEALASVGIHVSSELLAFTFDASEYTFPGNIPLQADTYTYSSRKYKCLPMDEESTFYRYTTSARDRIRIFVKEINA